MPALAALPHDAGDGGGRHRDDGEVGRLRQLRYRPYAPQPVDLGRVRVHRVDAPGEARPADVPQDRLADGVLRAARSHHSHRGRVQQVRQAGHVGQLRAACYCRQVPAVLAQCGLPGNRHGQPDYAVGPAPQHAEPGVGEDLQHRRVIRQCLRGERRQLADPGQRNQVLKQQRGDAAAVHLVRDGKGDFRLARGRGRLVARRADDRAVDGGEQRGVIGPGGAAEPPRLLLGGVLAHAEEPHVEIRRRHRLVHAADRVKVVRARGPDFGGGTVGQQHENAAARAGVPGAAGGWPCPGRRASCQRPGRLRARRQRVPADDAGVQAGDTSATCPVLSHLMMYGGEPSAFRSPMTRPIRSDRRPGSAGRRSEPSSPASSSPSAIGSWPRAVSRDLPHVSAAVGSRPQLRAERPGCRSAVPAAVAAAARACRAACRPVAGASGSFLACLSRLRPAGQRIGVSILRLGSSEITSSAASGLRPSEPRPAGSR